MEKERIKVIRDPKAIVIGMERNRREILKLLRFNDLTVSQMAEILEKDESTIYRHIKKLEDVGLVSVVGERKRYHIPEKVYGRKSNLYIFAMDKEAPEEQIKVRKNYEREMANDMVEKLKNLGYSIKNKEKTSNLILKLFKNLREGWEEKLEDKNLDFEMYWKLFTINLILTSEKDEKMKSVIKKIAESIE